jgi:O-antigen/teichoic acid export membrane protein
MVLAEKPDKPQGKLKSLLTRARGTSWRDAVGGTPKKFLSSVGWQYGGTLTGSVVSFAFTMYVANALGVAEFGLMALGLAFAALVSQLVNVNLREIVIRYIAKFWTDGDKERTLAMTKLTLLVDVAAGIVAMALIMGLSPLARMFLIKDDRAIAIIALAGCAYVFQNVADDTALGLLRVFSRFKALAYTEVAGAVLKLAGAVAIIHWLKGGILGILAVVAGVHLLQNLVRLALALAELRSHIPLRSHAPLSLLAPYRDELKRFFGYNYLRSISNFATRDLDINVLGLFAPTAAAVGVYKLAKSFFNVLYQLADAALLVVYPEIAKLWAGRQFGKLRHFVKSLTLIMSATGIAIYGAAFFAVPWVITLMKPEYTEAGDLFRLMGWGIVIWSPFVWTGPLLLAANRPDLLLRCSLITGLSVLGLYFLLCWQMGAPGAAIVAALTHTIYVIVALWSGRRAGIIFPTEDTAAP